MIHSLKVFIFPLPHLAVINSHIVHVHQPNRCGASILVVWESPTNSQIQQNEVSLMKNRVPRIRTNSAFEHSVEQDSIHIPLQRLRRNSTIDFNGVSMKLPWQGVLGQVRFPGRPSVSMQGPPGLTLQWTTPQRELIPFTFSMISNSPTEGQFW